MKRFLPYPCIISFLLSALLFISCEDRGPDFMSEEMPLVVEGWIENGEPPVVMVTRALNLNDISLSLDESVEKWCRVSVFDGDTRHILSGKIDRNYTPPFIYTTISLKGETGHTYRLLVETDGETAEASGTITVAPVIERIVPEKSAEADSLYQLRIFLKDIDPGSCYKIFCRSKQTDKRYYSAFLGTFQGTRYIPEEGYVVTKGLHATYAGDDFSHFFRSGDVVFVKVCSVSREIYDFWTVYDNNISLSNNLFFSFSENCPSTVEGALGYWGAYATATSAVRIP